MLEAQKITKTYKSARSGATVKVLDAVSLSLRPEETLGLMGPSGCGKSTLARILLRLIPCDSGCVTYRGEDVTHLRWKALLPYRRRVQMISQRPESFFDPSMLLEKSMEEPLKLFGLYDKKAYEEALGQLMEQIKLSRSLLERYPHQVSGGEIQRLSICRALLLKPEVLILDEPTSMLDVSVQAQILHLLRELQQKQRLSYLFISHDESIVDWMSDRRLTMDRGRLV